MNDIHLYSGYFSNNTVPFRLELSEMPIKKIYADGTIETQYPYFISPVCSTHYFGGRSGKNLEEEYQLNFGKVFYSTDKEKCWEWLKEIYKNEQDRIVKEYDAIN